MSVKTHIVELTPADQHLWSGSAPVTDRPARNGRTVSVDLVGLQLGYNQYALAREIEVVDSTEVEMATFMLSCPKIVLNVRRGFSQDATKVVTNWMSALEAHIQNLPPRRTQELFSNYAPSVEDAVAEGSTWDPRGRQD